MVTKKTLNPFIFIVLFGLIFFLVGSLVFISNGRKLQGSTKVQATIIAIAREWNDSNDEVDEVVFISYEIDEVGYNERLNYYSSSMKEGDTLEIYVNKDDPKSFVYPKGVSIFSLVFCVVGLCFVIVGQVLMLWYKKRSQKVNLMVTGRKVLVTLREITTNMHVTMNGVHPRKLVFVDSDYNEYTCSSTKVEEEYFPVGTKIYAYLDQRKKNSYYLDLEQIVSKA